MSENRQLKTPESQIIWESKSRRKVLIVLFLGIGFGGNCLNWIFAHTLVWFIGELAFITATVFIMGLYFLLFPGKFYAHYRGKANALLIIVLIFSLLSGYVNYYAFKHGLY